MIQLNKVTKKFAGITVVDNISFSVAKGELIGFLGPNGAGKSTVMRMITGFLRPDNGKIYINSKEVNQNLLYIKKRIGYLPENISLYPEMRVTEYLKYRAVLKKIKLKHIKNSIENVLDQCDIADVKNKVISKLSKGYTQRVGLADALLNDPEILILDEPTNGLDPKQKNQVLKLIKNLKNNKTVILSTHILSEIESVCEKVIIINNGKIITQKNIADFNSNNSENKYKVKIKTDKKEYVVEKIKNINSVIKIENLNFKDSVFTFNIILDNKQNSIDEFYNVIRKDDNIILRELSLIKNKLEDIFIKLIDIDYTGKNL